MFYVISFGDDAIQTLSRTKMGPNYYRNSILNVHHGQNVHRERKLSDFDLRWRVSNKKMNCDLKI
jgi:hypothetical protein